MNEVRLIDANALKANLPEPTTIKQDWVYRTLCDFIDNAPTVLTYSEEDMCNATSGGYDIGYDMARRLYERPQGEWIDYSNEGYVECPFCGSATTCEDNKDELHYCWNCGADMRGEKKWLTTKIMIRNHITQGFKTATQRLKKYSKDHKASG